jgi:hypothetical protein
VVYGNGILALDESPVVVQVPDFGDRFWVYQVVDSRTDSFAELGKVYGTEPGFYLLVGPNWVGTVPRGIRKVFASQTCTAVVLPRVFRQDTPEDLEAVQPLLNQIGLYPVSRFDGTMKVTDWRKVPKVPNPPDVGAAGDAETKWVPPDRFLDLLPAALADAKPLAGESARYAQVLAVVEAARKNTRLRAVFEEALVAADKELIEPLFEFRNYGRPLPHHWSTIANGAAFGTDYFTRTAVAKSNIFVNKQNETKYFYQDLDDSGARLASANRYTITFAKGTLPPVRGFWSLTLYNQHHFFEPNAMRRYSIGTKNKGLALNADGSLTVHVQARTPGPGKESNWLPAASDGASAFSLYIRCYWPEQPALDGRWTPPPVTRLDPERGDG